MTTRNVPFTADELGSASAEWGCNCGPAALAFALQVKLDVVRHAIPGFALKRYTTPTGMAAALECLRQATARHAPNMSGLFNDRFVSLVLVQWTGPWTGTGLNQKWAYLHTHWIATWGERGVPLVYDVNAGIQGLGAWTMDTAVSLIRRDPRRTGWAPKVQLMVLGNVDDLAARKGGGA
ncbi:MAG: hypothetical protein ACREJO_03545 [Phycisphaerales bacterium]